MKIFRIMLGLVLLISLAGCEMMSSSDVSVKETVKIEKGPKKVTFLNNTPYVADMSVALAELGFEVIPMAYQQQVTMREHDNGERQFNEASTRWGISLMKQYSGMTCPFTDFNISRFTLMLTDIETNREVLVLKLHPCTLSEPVFDSLAYKLAENW